MRWLVFLIFTLVMLALETGLRTLLVLPPWGTAPSLVLVLAVFVAVWAPPATVAWASLILGVVVDLAHPVPARGVMPQVALIGPAALGYLAGGYLAVQIRGMVFRDSPLALALLVVILGFFMHVVTIGLLAVRGWVPGEPIPNFHAPAQLLQATLQVLYSGVLAVPLGFLLTRTAWLWGFEPTTPR